MSEGERRRALIREAAELVAEMLGLPVLIGSPTQQAWAICIRDEKLHQIGQVRTDRRAACVRLEQNLAQIAVGQVIVLDLGVASRIRLAAKYLRYRLSPLQFTQRDLHLIVERVRAGSGYGVAKLPSLIGGIVRAVYLFLAR